MAAPVFAAESEGTWGAATLTQTRSVTVAVGDVLVIVGATEDAQYTLATPTGGAQTYTLQKSFVGVGFCATYVWTAVMTTAQTYSVSVTVSNAAARWGLNVLRFTGSAGVGASAVNHVASAAPSVAITTTGANSAVVAFVSDWSATDGATRTWRTVNGITPTAGNALEVTYAFTTTAYTAYGAYWSDAGAAGAKTLGLTVPAAQTYAIVSVEVLGTAGPAPVNDTARGGVGVGARVVATKTSRSTGASSTTTSALAGASKTARSTGAGLVGTSARVVATRPGASTASGGVGVGARVTAAKTAQGVGPALVGVSARASAVHVSARSGSTSVGLLARVVATRGGSTAGGGVGVGARVVATKSARGSGVASVGVGARATSVATRVAVGRCVVGAVGRVGAARVALSSARGSLGAFALATALFTTIPTRSAGPRRVSITRSAISNTVGRSPASATITRKSQRVSNTSPRRAV